MDWTVFLAIVIPLCGGFGFVAYNLPKTYILLFKASQWITLGTLFYFMLYLFFTIGNQIDVLYELRDFSSTLGLQSQIEQLSEDLGFFKRTLPSLATFWLYTKFLTYLPAMKKHEKQSKDDSSE